MSDISHYQLCKLTAERFLKQSRVVLYEYQSYATSEFPDVLCFKGGYTILYEIKVDYQDFKKDNLKDCRVEKKIRCMANYKRNSIGVINDLRWRRELREFICQAPHLGRERFYVCPAGLIQPDEIRNGWGLYWYTGKQIRIKKKSQKFKANIYEEMRILEHAFRKYYCGDAHNVLINGYKD